MTLTLTSIHRYPVKSMRGSELGTARVEPWGLQGDRRWVVVEADKRAGTFLSARKDPWMATLDVELRGDGGLTVRPAAGEPLVVDVPAPQRHVEVTVWGSNVPAVPADPAADAWLSALARRPVQLVHMDDPRARAVDPDFSAPSDRVSFADGFPLLLTTHASLSALGDQIVDGSDGAEDPVRMDRFRPNVVVDGDEPWAEDDWRRIRIGGVGFRATKGCERCVMTTIDPATGERGPEPLRTLVRTRRFDSGAWFGINLIPDLPEGADAPTIGVGDRIEVLDAVSPGSGPLR